MAKSTDIWAYLGSKRFSLVMTCLSSLFWFTSSPVLPVAEDFPNCVSFRADLGLATLGFVSISHTSAFFLSRDSRYSGDNCWDERGDGHFCGFTVPGTEFGFDPSGFGMGIGSETLYWECPYLLMTVAWYLVYLRSQSRLRFSITDLIMATTIVAGSMAVVVQRCALPLILAVNLISLALFIYLATVAFWVTWKRFRSPVEIECKTLSR